MFGSAYFGKLLERTFVIGEKIIVSTTQRKVSRQILEIKGSSKCLYVSKNKCVREREREYFKDIILYEV